MKDIPLPIRGINRGSSVTQSPKEFSASMNNVRPRDSLEGRLRLGQRPGLVKWGEGTQVGEAEQPVVSINSVSSVV